MTALCSAKEERPDCRRDETPHHAHQDFTGMREATWTAIALFGPVRWSGTTKDGHWRYDLKKNTYEARSTTCLTFTM